MAGSSTRINYEVNTNYNRIPTLAQLAFIYNTPVRQAGPSLEQCKLKTHVIKLHIRPSVADEQLATRTRNP